MLGTEGAELGAAYLGECWGEPTRAKASSVYRNYRNPWGMMGGGSTWSCLTNGEMLSGRKEREGGWKMQRPKTEQLEGQPRSCCSRDGSGGWWGMLDW